MTAWWNRGAAGAACLAVGATLLAGCLSGERAGAAVVGDPLHAPGARHDDGSCSIRGVVTDDSYAAVPEARVAVAGAGLVGASDAGGRFAFSYVPPGGYVVAAAKDGYEGGPRSVECRPNSDQQVDFVLEPVPEPGGGFSQMFPEERGLIGCAFGSPAIESLTTKDLCKELGTAPMAQAAVTIEPKPQPVTGAVIEMQWDATGMFGGEYLLLDYPEPETPDVAAYTENRHRPVGEGSDLAGRSPLRLELVAENVDDPLWLRSPGERLRFEVRAAGSDTGDALADPTNDGSSRLVLDQEFSLFVTFFYNGMPIPPGFTQLPDG